MRKNHGTLQCCLTILQCFRFFLRECSKILCGTALIGSQDMYRVIFHPQMVSVCDKVNYKAPGPGSCGVQTGRKWQRLLLYHEKDKTCFLVNIMYYYVYNILFIIMLRRWRDYA